MYLNDYQRHQVGGGGGGFFFFFFFFKEQPGDAYKEDDFTGEIFSTVDFLEAAAGFIGKGAHRLLGRLPINNGNTRGKGRGGIELP